MYKSHQKGDTLIPHHHRENQIVIRVQYSNLPLNRVEKSLGQNLRIPLKP